ncbi:MAG: hypothetical protein BIP78_1525 [Candidatus Bipolaricaulis sibiricus]|uniref:Uncharacterized protein n=1 Tax=Bipolaricaulis sibiricus TaxID=2501609 RepID=A0A410FWF5_BIPS1|nr:MAG: hypothetical protein BIP78_1525 [Candidatus Bipolaricaulis sibiricus]
MVAIRLSPVKTPGVMDVTDAPSGAGPVPTAMRPLWEEDNAACPGRSPEAGSSPP